MGEAMASETIGTARVDIVVNTDQFDTAINAAKRSVADMSTDAQQQYNKLNASEKRRIDSLLKQATTLGFTREQQIVYNAALRGEGPLLDEITRKLRAKTTATKQAGIEFNKYGLSAKQTTAALRQVPAQVTDIFTSLAAGQNPLTVLIQQGGQLKDVFGGVAPAARALGSSLLGLINPLTLTVGAIAAIVLAWEQGESQARAFDRALILTGNYADTTAEQLGNLATELDGLAGTTTREAAAALAAVAATGQFTGEQIELVTRAALQMQAATGKAIEDTVAEFVKLRKDPVEAILELNQTQHFLTESQLENIVALKEQGREQDAVTAAFRAYAGEIDSRAPAITGNLGLIQGGLRGVRDLAAEAWDGFVNGIQRADRQAKESLDTFGRLFSFLRGGAPGGVFGLQAAISTPVAVSSSGRGGRTSVDSAAAKKDLEERKKAEEEFARLELSNLSKKEKLEREIVDIRETGTKAGKSQLEIEKQIGNARARYAESLKKPAGAKSLESAGNKAALQAFKDQLKEEQGAIANATQLLQAEYSARLVTVQQYYTKQKELTQQGAAAQEKALLGQIGVLKARGVTGKEGIDTARELATLETELAKIRADSSTKLAILNIQEADALKQRRQAAEAYKAALDESAGALQAQFDGMVARISTGEREFEIQQQITELYREQAKELLELARARDAGDIDQSTYDERVELLRSAIEREVSIVEDGYARMAEAQANWVNGASKAMADFIADADDISGQANELFSNTFKGITDAVVGFSKGSKDAFDNLMDYWYEEAVRFLSDQAIKAFLKALGGGGGGSASGAETAGSIFDLFAGSGFGFAKGGPVGFASGGYTGSGSKYEAAGIVHRGEYVINAEATRALGRGVLERMNRGVLPVASGGNTYNVSVPVYGSIDGRTRLQVANAVSREQRLASRIN